MNLNGHLSSTDICSTGAIDSGFFIPKRYVEERLPGEALAWSVITVAGEVVTILSGYNIISVTRTSVGNFLVNITYSVALGINEIDVIASVAGIFVPATQGAPATATNTVTTVEKISQTSFTLHFSIGNTKLPVTPVGFSFIVYGNP